MTNDKTDIDVYLVKHFGMTAEAIVRVMKNHRRIVNSEAHEVIEHLDFYMNPTDYVDEDALPENWNESGDGDGYPELYTYAEDLFGDDGPAVFKRLISQGTTHGGMGSALEALRLIKEAPPRSEEGGLPFPEVQP